MQKRPSDWEKKKNSSSLSLWHPLVLTLIFLLLKHILDFPLAATALPGVDGVVLNT